MKKRIIVTAAITACLALCAAVWPQAETVEKTPATSETTDRKSTRLNSSHRSQSRMPSSA